MLEMLSMVKESCIIWIGVPQKKQRKNGAKAMFDKIPTICLMLSVVSLTSSRKSENNLQFSFQITAPKR